MLGFLLLIVYLFAVYGEDDLFHHLIGFGKHKILNFNHQGTSLKRLSATYSCDNVTENWFTDAVIDNFAPIEKQRKWVGRGQRYFVNKEFWGGNDFPLFVFIGGEGEEKCTRLTSYMYLYDLAKEHRAMLIDVEHRFYGQSLPTADDSTENLQYLSSDQALADLARIITHIKTIYATKGSRVITIGGSYPGNLAAWFRLKYPHVSHGSIASSAPVLAQTNFPEYMDVVAQALIHFSGQQCYNAFEEAAEIVANLALQGYGSAGIQKLQTDFEVCSPISNDLDLSVFLSDLMGNVQGTVQYNNEHNGVLNVTDICNIITQPESDAYTNFVQLQKSYRQANGQSCEDGNWDDTVKALTSPGAGRSWTYQTCNEFGYYQTTDSKNQPFKSWKWINLNFSREICAAAFNGWTSDPQVQWINNFYGDLSIAGTNIVFPSGTIDPWHALAVSNTTAKLPEVSEVKVFIEGTAHCNDLYAPANSDPPSLTYARQVIAGEVKKWLI